MMGLWDLGGMAQALPEIFGAKVAWSPWTLAIWRHGLSPLAASAEVPGAMVWGSGVWECIRLSKKWLAPL